MSKKTFKCGSIQSPADERNFISTAVIPRDTEIPRRFMWDSPRTLEQGSFGTCVGFGAANLKNIQEKAQADYVDEGFSPLFIYTLCKQQDGYPNIEGTFIQLALDNLLKMGIPPEKEFPYSQLVEACKIPTIPDRVKELATPYKIKTYTAVPFNDIDAIRRAILVSPVVVGSIVTDSFMYPAYGGWVGAPKGRVHGGHCYLIDGFDDDLVHAFNGEVTRKGFCRINNSWGDDWGDKSVGWISYEDLMTPDLVYEMWSTVDIIVTPEPTTPKYWKVQVGAYGVKENAQKMVTRAKAAGFPTYLPPKDSDGLYHVQIGAFSIKDNAIKLRDKLLDNGFAGAFIVQK